MKKLVLLLPCVFLTACVYTQHTNLHQSKGVDSQQFQQIEIGKTDKQWVLRNIGMPDRIQTDQDADVFEYVKENIESSDHRFIFLFSIESEKVVSRRVTQITMHNGIVQKLNTVEEKI